MELMLNSWRTKTNDSLFRKWHCWCDQQCFDPVSGPTTSVVNFLASLHKEGYQYNSVNAYRSAISSVHEKVDGNDVGKHPLVVWMLKGIYHDRPPLPRYTCTWNVQTVLNYQDSLGDNDTLSLKQLTWKVTMLLALTRPSQSTDLSLLDIAARQYTPNGVTFLPSCLAKQSRQGKPISEFFFSTFPTNSRLCPVPTHRAYEERTESLRNGETKLFLALIKPHMSVTSCTVARWLKALLQAAGMDTSIFSATRFMGRPLLKLQTWVLQLVIS